jgi:GNAT superfamily N-acetyltransferase
MVTIEPVRALSPTMLSELVADAEVAGLAFPRRLVTDWAAGTNRFDRPGEILFAARLDGRVVGMCGLNADPYTTEARVGRVRHLYVEQASRRRGVGRALVAAVLAAARGPFDRLRLRTSNPEAARLYEAMGFAPCTGEEACTHALDLVDQITGRRSPQVSTGVSLRPPHSLQEPS